MPSSPPPSLKRTPPPSRPRPQAPAPPKVNDPIHMLKERGNLKDTRGRKPAGARGVSIRVGCGAEGHPYDGVKGMRSTIWPSMVTCEGCKALPSVVPIFADPEPVDD